MRAVGRLMVYDALRSLASPRWLLAVPALALAAWLSADDLEYDIVANRAFHATIWDAPPNLLVQSLYILVIALGFIFLVGDLFLRDHTEGGVGLTLPRVGDRRRWWTAKICAIGLLALVYTALLFTVVLATGALKGLPWSLHVSEVARLPVGGVGPYYPRPDGMLPAVLDLLLIPYVACGLWALGAVALTCSVLWPKPFVPFALPVAWLIADEVRAPLTDSRSGLGVIDPLYQLSYGVHFDTRVVEGLPWSVSAGVLAATVAACIGVGAVAFKRAEL
jgi:hypothetical protein